MQTRKDVMAKVAALVGDPFYDWLTPEYFSPLANLAYENAIQLLDASCSPYIEKVVIVPGVEMGADESNLVPFAVGEGDNQTKPLDRLKKPRLVQYRISGSTYSPWLPMDEYEVLPDAPQAVTPTKVDIRVRGDFLPAALTGDDSVVEIHPLAGQALALSTAALIGMERPNPGWVQNYGTQAMLAWEQISGELTRQQQHVTQRLGSPNRQNQRGLGWNVQQNAGWEWRSFGLYVKFV